MFSIITEVPPPPPLQMPAIPYFPEFCFSTDSRDKTILEPDILHYNFSYPTGWPKATAPPFTLIFSIPMSKSFIFASTVTAKASLISWKSMLLILRLFIVALIPSSLQGLGSGFRRGNAEVDRLHFSIGI